MSVSPTTIANGAGASNSSVGSPNMDGRGKDSHDRNPESPITPISVGSPWPSIQGLRNNRPSKPLSKMPYETSHERWLAVTARAKDADGHFVYAVKSTGIFCRPTCAARLARRANVEFYRRPDEAQAAGFRPCKRCKPDLEGPEHDTQEQAVRLACDVIARHARESESAAEDDAGEGSSFGPVAPSKGLGLKELAQEVGKTPRYLHKIFKDRMGVTPKQYEEQMKEMYRPRLSIGSASGSIPAGLSTSTSHQTPEEQASTAFQFDPFDLDMDFGSEMTGPTEHLDVGEEFAITSLSDLLTDGNFSSEGTLTTPITPNNVARDLAPTSTPGLDESFATSAMSPGTVDDLLKGTSQDPSEWEDLVDNYRADNLLSNFEPHWRDSIWPSTLPATLSI